MPIKKYIFIILLLFSSLAMAYKSQGRINLGGFFSTERYKDDTYGSNSNDSLRLLGRFYYKISELGTDQWELISDFRDFHDSFGKLNKEDLQLDQRNEFQTRQLSARWVNPDGHLSSTVGRFQVPEAGTVFVDGLLSEFRHSTEFHSAVFGGLNPKAIERSYLEFNQNAQQYGVYFTFESKSKGWDKSNYLSHALVRQTYYSQVERSYLFHNWIYQWENESRWISYAILDFVPRTSAQVFNLIYQQKLNTTLSSELNVLGIDLVGYRRNQDLLEQLTPSPYQEAKTLLNHKINNNLTAVYSLSSGQRDIDKLKREEYSLGLDRGGFISRHFDLRGKIGYRNNFTSKDQYIKANIGYYSRKWESYVDLQYEVKKPIDGKDTHPIYAEWGLTTYVGKELFVTGSYQRAADENVTILAGFLKIGYRFGRQELPPIRDGAPARGQL